MNLRSIAGAALGAFFCTVCFFAGLFGVCWAIRQALPFPDIPIVRQKIEYLAGNADKYNTLYLGSSRIHYQIIPALFDRLAAGHGLSTRSFNAGIAATNPPEDAYYLDYILRHPPKNLRWVFLELAPVRTFIYPDRVASVRSVYWHDWPRFRLLIERALVTKPRNRKKKGTWRKTLGELRESFGELADHVPLFFKYQANLGRGTILSSRLILDSEPPEPPLERMLGDDLAGWIPTGRPEEMSGRQLAEYEEALADRQADPAKPTFSDPVSQKALEQMIAKIEKLGATAVLVVPPTTNKNNFHPAPERARKTIVLDFSDMKKFPELFEKRYRLDTDHVNTAGSELFTKMLVREWVAEMQRRK